MMWALKRGAFGAVNPGPGDGFTPTAALRVSRIFGELRGSSANLFQVAAIHANRLSQVSHQRT